MDDPAFLLVLGFLLTSVLGGALAYYFQDRTWKHQRSAQQRDQRREQAMKVFEEVSSLLDKRLYRMRLLFWAAKRRAPAGRDSPDLREALDEYRHVVAEWNDNLNRTLALVHTYFGGRAREQLEDHLYEEYSAAGRQLDQFVRDVSAPGHADISVPSLNRRLNWLGREVYALNLQMLESLDNDKLGPEAPAGDPAWRSATPLLQFGNQGTDTQRLQRALRRAGKFDARIDGSFGRETEEAVRSFQQEAGLDDNGVVDTSVWNALPSEDSDTSGV